MREIKFRVWDNLDKTMGSAENTTYIENNRPSEFNEFVFMQYTGLKDKKGVEIYEYMELDNQFEVSFSQGSYILTNISNGDIMTLYNYIKDKNGQVKITREYTKI